MTPGFKALSSRRPVRQNKDIQHLSKKVRTQEPSPLTSVKPRPTLTFWTAVCCPYHCSILPDLQVGFSVLVVICVEVPLSNLTPKLEEGAGVRDGVCLVDPHQEDSQQQTGPQSQGPSFRFHPVHHGCAALGRAPGKRLRSQISWNWLLTPVPQQSKFRFRLGLRQRVSLFLLC